jgi:hypothetical protein
MLACYVPYVILHAMARGKSGRIVIEIDPSAKSALYASLARDNRTLKDWFIENVGHYLKDHDQPRLFDEGLLSARGENEDKNQEA